MLSSSNRSPKEANPQTSAASARQVEEFADSLLAAFETRLAEAMAELRDELRPEQRAGGERMEPLLGVREVAELLACDPRSVHRWSREGAIPGPVRIGGVLRWYAPALRDWLMERSEQAR